MPCHDRLFPVSRSARGAVLFTALALAPPFLPSIVVADVEIEGGRISALTGSF